jgi:hypothetical protein
VLVKLFVVQETLDYYWRASSCLYVEPSSECSWYLSSNVAKRFNLHIVSCLDRNSLNESEVEYFYAPLQFYVGLYGK